MKEGNKVLEMSEISRPEKASRWPHPQTNEKTVLASRGAVLGGRA